jgi:hypothetical protein
MDPDPDKLSLTFKTPTKNIFSKMLFCLLLSEGTFSHLHDFSKIKRQKEVTKQ